MDIGFSCILRRELVPVELRGGKYSHGKDERLAMVAELT